MSIECPMTIGKTDKQINNADTCRRCTDGGVGCGGILSPHPCGPIGLMHVCQVIPWHTSRHASAYIQWFQFCLSFDQRHHSWSPVTLCTMGSDIPPKHEMKTDAWKEAIPEKLVLSTWSGTLQEESSLSWYASSTCPRPSPTPSAYTPVSLWYTLRKLAQPRHSCRQTKLGSMSNFPGLCPYVLGHHLFVFFSICRICLMHFHWW